MRRTRTGLVGLALIMAVMTGCGTGRLSAIQAQSGGQAAFLPNADAQSGAHANNQLALAILRHMANDKSIDGNLQLAPASIGSSLAMLTVGAVGNTAAQMTSALGFPGNTAAITRTYGSLARSMASAPQTGAELAQANRVWIQQGGTLNPAFESTLKHDFVAEVGQVDFIYGSEPARETINRWVEEKTAGYIQTLLPTLDPSARLLITNALYLRATWEQPFDSKLSGMSDFHSAKGDLPGKFMHQNGTFRYGESAGLAVVELPYANSTMAMDIVIPPEGQEPWKIDSFPGELEQALAALQLRSLSMTLPIFTVDASVQLNDALKGIGMGEAFGGNADFSGITGKRDMRLAGVIHKTYLSLTEKGTEAGASTASSVFGTVRGGEQVVFNANRPFLYLIRDTATGGYIFAGVLNEPQFITH